MQPEAWRARAACLNKPLEWFYPNGRQRVPREVTAAKGLAVCEGCPVRIECLEYALAPQFWVWGRRNYGVWGGFWFNNSETEGAVARRGGHELLKQLRSAAA